MTQFILLKITGRKNIYVFFAIFNEIAKIPFCNPDLFLSNLLGHTGWNRFHHLVLAPEIMSVTLIMGIDDMSVNITILGKEVAEATEVEKEAEVILG